jgi:hypothetical protein
MTRVGYYEFRGLNRLADQSALRKNGRYHRCGKAFTEAGDGITCSQSQLFQERRSLAQTLAFLKNLFQVSINAASHRNRMNQLANHCAVTFAEFLENHLDRTEVPTFGPRGGFNEFICDTTHSRDDHDQITIVCGVANNLHDFPDAGRVAHRCSAKFHNS